MAAPTDPGLRKMFRGPNFEGGMRPASHFPTREEVEEALDPMELLEQVESASSAFADFSCCKIGVLAENVDEGNSSPQLDTFWGRLVQIDSIVTLDLHRSEITFLPDDIGILCNLKKLVATENRLKRLPDSLCMCEELEEASFRNNQLDSLPESFADLPKLRILNLAYNYFTEIPPVVVGSIPTLQQVDLYETSVGALPPADKWLSNRCLRLGLDNSPKLGDAVQQLEQSLPAGTKIEPVWNKIWPDRVRDSIYLGSLRTVQDTSVFEKIKVTHVLTCGRNLKEQLSLPPTIKHLVLEVDDSVKEPIAAHFTTAIDFLNQAESTSGVCVVHCFAGVSRSATVVMAYLMKQEGLSFDDALKSVRDARAVANPNPSFISQLRDFEKALKA